MEGKKGKGDESIKRKADAEVCACVPGVCVLKDGRCRPPLSPVNGREALPSPVTQCHSRRLFMYAIVSRAVAMV